MDGVVDFGHPHGVDLMIFIKEFDSICHSQCWPGLITLILLLSLQVSMLWLVCLPWGTVWRPSFPSWSHGLSGNTTTSSRGRACPVAMQQCSSCSCYRVSGLHIAQEFPHEDLISLLYWAIITHAISILCSVGVLSPCVLSLWLVEIHQF